MERMEKAERRLDNYKMVDILKLAAAVMVVCIHCAPLFSLEPLNYFIKQVLCRIAVPFFFISSAFFVRKSSCENPDYLKNYLKKSLKSYLAWSIVFIPIGVDWLHQNLALSGKLLPFALLFGLVYVGTYYHLWYIPAMIFSLFLTDRLLKRFSYKLLFPLSLLLYLFGSLETYYGLLPAGWFKGFFDAVIQIFFTTRGGLLFGLVFTAIGFFIYDYREKLKTIAKFAPLFALFSGGLLVIEGVFLYRVPKLDMNFLLMLVPFSFFFFVSVLAFPRVLKSDTRKIRTLSKYYYFVHPICIVLVEEIGQAFQWGFPASGIVSFFSVLLMTHVLCSITLRIQQRPLQRSLFIPAALAGILATVVFAGLFYQLKPGSSLVRFELVPCIWVFCSFIIYFLLARRLDPRPTAAEF